jgi:hypothetical protein
MGMVLSVHRHPLARSRARRDPDHESAGESHRGLQRDGPVGQRSMQVHRRDDEGNLGGEQPDQDGL